MVFHDILERQGLNLETDHPLVTDTSCSSRGVIEGSYLSKGSIRSQSGDLRYLQVLQVVLLLALLDDRHLSGQYQEQRHG